MKIAIYVADLDVQGGTHKQILKLAKYLDKKKHTVTIFTPCYTFEKTYPEFLSLNVVFLRKRSNDHLYTAKIFGRLIDQFRLFYLSKGYDIVNVHDNRTKLFILLHIFFRRANLVWQINDVETAFNVRKNSDISIFRRILYNPLNRFFARFVASRVHKCLVNVSKNKDRVFEYLNIEAEVIYCGVDFLTPRPIIPVISKEIRIVTTGILARYRNYESLIRAAAIINNNKKYQVKIVVIGDLRYDKLYLGELENLTSELNVNTYFSGAVSQNELRNFYENAHLFSFINIDQSWGLSVFEAASIGLPVILSKSVGAVELLQEKIGMFIVDPISINEIVQSILEIVKDQEYYNSICGNVSSVVKKMSWDEMYSKKVEKIFYSFFDDEIKENYLNYQ